MNPGVSRKLLHLLAWSCLLLAAGGTVWGLRRARAEALPEWQADARTFSAAFSGGSRTGDCPLLLGDRAPWSSGGNRVRFHALDWFASQQMVDGSWRRYVDNGRLPAVPGVPAVSTMTRPGVVLTAGVVLVHLAYGFDHRHPNPFRRRLQRALDWLLAQQHADGSWGDNYPSAMATMALCETFSLTQDPALQEPAQCALDHLLVRQNPGDPAGVDRGGWSRDHPDPACHDTFVTLWCVMALKSGSVAELDIGQGLAGAKWWLTSTWRRANPDWANLDPQVDGSRFPASFDALAGRVEGEGGEPAAALAACFLGCDADQPLLATLANHLVATRLPAVESGSTEAYRHYLTTLTLYQVGGDRWTRWSRAACSRLRESQCRTGPHAGSWDPAGAGDDRSASNCRNMITIYRDCSLMTYYCYVSY